MSKKRKGWRKPQFQRNPRQVDANRGDVSRYRDHMRSAATGELVPISQAGTILGQCARWEDVQPKFVMPDSGYQIPEERDPAPPFVRVILKLWKTDRHQGIDSFYSQPYPHPEFPDLRLFFSGNEYLWGYYTETYLRLSTTYVGRGPAEYAYKMNRIVWIQRIPLAPS